MADLLQTKEFSIADENGKEWHFILSKFPSVQGREIIAQYPRTILPVVGKYEENEEIMIKLMSFVGVKTGEIITKLSTMPLINNHTADWEMLSSIEMAMMEYNCRFFRDGRISSFLTGFVQSAMVKISEILTGSLGQSSPAEKQPSTSSAPSTP